MLVKFNNDYLENLYEGKEVKGKPRYSEQVIKKFIQKINILKNIENSSALRQFRGLNFEELKGDKKGIYSMRVDLSYRLEFRLQNDIITLTEIALIDDMTKHYQ
ncbi:MAG: type II toxin-antitoxin system RelE/ParE family toxin [Spirosomataceae bacterium]